MRAFLAAILVLGACGSDDEPPPGETPDAAGGGGADGGGGSSMYQEVAGWIDDWTAAHPGSAGDINALGDDEIAGDPDAQRLLDLCGDRQTVRPVIPRLAWEYGGADHAWINPEQSALVYCVYIPVSPSTENWGYDAGADRVTADVWVLFPEENPCADRTGADQVDGCIGDQTNYEILVDTASLHDGADAGLTLAEASTELLLVLTDGTKVHLITNL